MGAAAGPRVIGHVAWRLLRRALVNLWRAPLPSLVAVLTIALALFLGAGFLSALQAAQLLLRGWGAEASLTLYLSPDATEAEAGALVSQLRQDGALEVVYVTRDEALTRLRKELGDLGSTLDGLAKNPLPPSIELRPRTRLSVDELRALAGRLSKLPKVQEVDYGREWLDRLEQLGRALRAGGAGATLLVLGAAILVVANTIRLAVYARRDEIEIMKLVGATNGYVRLPFLLEGALQGLAGAGLALLGLLGVEKWLLPQATAAFSFAAGIGGPAVHAPEGLALLLFGAAVGLVGSWLSVARFLRT
jgi:cell division transport system permease protein